jgi:hypothetical protein
MPLARDKGDQDMSDLPKDISLNAQVEYAENKVGAAQSRALSKEAIDAWREQCRAFIESANLSHHARSMAIPKMDEMIFWIRAGTGRN